MGMQDISALFKRVQRRFKQARVDQANQQKIKSLWAQVSQHAPKVDGAAPVAFFNASTRLGRLSLNAAYSLISSLGFQLSGTPVVHFVCQSGMLPCVLGTNRDHPDRNPPCELCNSFSDKIYAGAAVQRFTYRQRPELELQLAGLSVPQLESFVYRGMALGEIVLPSLRWILRRHHLSDDAETKLLFRRYILSACGVAEEFTAFLDQTRPQAVVLFNGMFYPEAVAKLISRSRGIPVISHEVALLPNTAFFTTGEATAYPIDIPESFELSEKQDEKLDAYLQQRLKGNFTMAGIRFWPEMVGLSPELLEKASQFRQIVPVFTNVVFDTSQGHANVVFPHMFAWLNLVLEMIKNHPDTLFVIRAHPDELRDGKESRESVAGWVARNQVAQYENVLFIDSKAFLSSYDLIQRSKFVMIYNSTIGLEASIMGAAVLCGGRARFTQLPTVFFPSTTEEYRQQAEVFLAADHIDIPEDHQRNARRFLYYQLFRTALPFERFIEPDGVMNGYVRLKPFSWRDLLPDNAPALRVIVDGVNQNQPFLLDE